MSLEAIQILKEFKVEGSINFVNLNKIRVQKRPGSKDVTQKISTRLQGTAKEQVSEEVCQKVNEAFSKANIKGEISRQLGVGDAFGDYGEISNVLEQGMTHLVHKKGEVLLVDVWATWCGPCQNPMKHNQEMLQKNQEKWKGKVRIVGVSVDDDKEGVIKRVTEKKWDKIMHLTLNKWDGEHKLIKDFNIEGIPFICVVDKFGGINYVGHPSQGNLQERINQLLQKTEEEVEEKMKNLEISNESIWDHDKVQIFKKLVSKQILEKQFENEEFFSLSIQIKEEYTNSKLNVNVSMKISAFEDNKNIVLKIKEKLKDLGSNIKLEQNKVKFLQVPLKPINKCWQCNQVLQFPFYWLKWQQNMDKFGCRKCIEKPSHQEGHHYNYEKNSVLLLNKWSRIALQGLGANIQPETPQMVFQCHQYCCNGCGGCPSSQQDIGKARYLCLACRADPNYYGDYVDICPNCMQGYINKKEEIVSSVNSDGHTVDHPWLRVLYNVNGYYKF